jgi:quercetin dioxygenase-like cupin family protein
MRPLILILALSLAAGASTAQVVVRNGPTLTLTRNALGVESAVIGDPDAKGGLYSYIVKYPTGVSTPWHTHPDDRLITVLSGTLYLVSGPDHATPETAQALPQGTVFEIKAGTRHHGWAKDGPVVLQETGLGPTANQMSPAKP